MYIGARNDLVAQAYTPIILSPDFSPPSYYGVFPIFDIGLSWLMKLIKRAQRVFTVCVWLNFIPQTRAQVFSTCVSRVRVTPVDTSHLLPSFFSHVRIIYESYV